VELRVGLTQRVVDLPDRGERRDALDQRWTTLLEGAGLAPIPIPNTAREPERFVTELDLRLIVFTGGNDLAHLPDASEAAPERDATESRLYAWCVQHELPALGVCRGLQLMVTLTGGTLSRVEGHVRRPHAIDVLGSAHGSLTDGRVVNSFHDWGVTTEGLGPAFRPAALAPDGTVEAAIHPSLPQVGVMWHPEREADPSEDVALIRALIDGTR
jgi:N5-(cytidine 5'-diphosphoramidyl)-L-glutamine hydrolase